MDKKISWLTDEIGMKTLNFVLLGIFSGGIYYFIWITERFSIFNSFQESEIISKQFINITAILMGLNILLGSTGDASMIMIGSLFSLAGWIMFIVLTFKIIKSMELYYADTFKLDLNFNKAWMVLFHLFYINYCINELKEIEAKKERLKD